MKYRQTAFNLVCLVILLMLGTELLAQQNNNQNQDQKSANHLKLTSLHHHSSKSGDNDQQFNQRSPKNAFSPATPTQENAFSQVTQKAMPMTPKQIHQLKRMLKETKHAAASPATTPPKPETTSIMVSLSPGHTPPVIRLQQGFISSLVFVDSNGNKWPIIGYDLGDPDSFNIQWQQNSNTLLVQATSQFHYGNLAVRLKGLPTPVMLTLVPGQRSVDYRVDLHIQGRSPTAKEELASSGGSSEGGSSGGGGITGVSNTLIKVLNGIPPKNSERLKVKGGRCQEGRQNCRAWTVDDKLYLRLPMEVLSPGWLSRVKSSDGMKAFKLEKTPSVLVSDHGQTTELKIEGY